MTTCGGVNSGKTSSRARRAAWSPAAKNRPARTRTTTRLRIDHATMACSISVVVHVAPELFRKEDLGLARDDRLAGRDAAGQDPAVPLRAKQLDLAAFEPARLNADVHEGPSLVVEHGGARHRDRRLRPGGRARKQRLHKQSRPPGLSTPACNSLRGGCPD